MLAARPAISKLERVGLLLGSCRPAGLLAGRMTVEESYAYCERLARKQAKNFYLSFLLLSAPQRRAMCAIYAFMRECDDLSDEDSVTDRAGLPSRAGTSSYAARWRDGFQSIRYGRLSPMPYRATKSPHEYFDEMIAGVSSDLEPRENRDLR